MQIAPVRRRFVRVALRRTREGAIEQRIAAHRLGGFAAAHRHLPRAARRIAVVVPGVVGHDDDQDDRADDGKSGLK